MQTIVPIIDKQGTANNIKYFMVKNGLSPTDIQRYLGLTCVQTVYRWLEGINIPTIDNLYALSQLFGVRIDDMISGSRYQTEKFFSKSLDSRMLAYYKLLHKAA